ncbi:MAG: hypothetical protein ACXV8U_12215 [Methylobacter sp.]
MSNNFKMDRYKALIASLLNKHYIISATLLVTACIIAVDNIAMVVAWHVPVPFSDEWGEFPRMIALRNEGFRVNDILSFIWEQHNEHRIVIPKIIYFIDMALFGYQGYFPIACIFLFQTIVVGMLTWLFIGNRRNSREILPFISLVIVAAFNLIQWENFASTFQTSFVGCFAFSVAAFVLYAKYTITGRRLYFWCTMLFATLASLSLASGLFVWIALALLAYLIHTKRYVQSFSFVGAFLGFLLLYLHGYISPAGHANPVDSLIHHPLLVLNYLTVWLGNVAGTVSSAKLLGSTALLALLAITIYLAHDKIRNRRIEIYTLLGICFFVLMAGFVTSLGRINFGVDQAMSSRYATPVLILWISLLGCCFLLALEYLRPLYIGITVGLILVTFVGLVIRNKQGEAQLIIFQNQQVQAYLAVVTGQYKEKPELLVPIFPTPILILDNINLLKSQNMSSFNVIEASSFTIGDIFPPLTMQKANACKGHIDAVTAIGKETYQIAGWAWNEVLSSYPEWVFLVRHGNIIGLGKPGVQRPDVLVAIPTINNMRIGWQGIARGTDGLGLDNIEAYISTQSGQYCRL